LGYTLKLLGIAKRRIPGADPMNFQAA